VQSNQSQDEGATLNLIAASHLPRFNSAQKSTMFVTHVDFDEASGVISASAVF
jgi:hypothetical protein